LADVRVVLAGQPPVRGLQLGLAGRGLHAQGLVVVLELHASGTWKTKARRRYPRAQSTRAPPWRHGRDTRQGPSYCPWLRRCVVSGRLGITTSSTPCLPVAVMRSGSALSGRAKRR